MTLSHLSNGQPLLDRAWQALRSLAARAREQSTPLELHLEGGGVRLDPESGSLQTTGPLSEDAAQMLALCLPLCAKRPHESFVYAHLGQSLDGQIATATGASRYVTGAANLTHMHRLRALADAVVVGAGTVERDDPRLTTRLVPGDNPVRVVIDPSLRLSPAHQVFSDGHAPTLLVSRAGAPRPAELSARVEIVEIPSESAELSPRSIVDALAKRGLRRLFIEGGGITVSRFLRARVLDRLHVTICPLFIGRGRPGLELPGVDQMEQALRPRASRFLLGEDVLFDCAFER